jgi:hypothetical protein
MGAIEICAPTFFDEKQVVIIKKHIALVEESQRHVHRRRQPNSMVAFCRTLKTILGDSVTLEAREFAVVKKLLDAEFVHFDAETEGDQDAMDHLHGDDSNARC